MNFFFNLKESKNFEILQKCKRKITFWSNEQLNTKVLQSKYWMVKNQSKNVLFQWYIKKIIITMIAYSTHEIVPTKYYGNYLACLNTFKWISKVVPYCPFTLDSYKIRRDKHYSDWVILYAQASWALMFWIIQRLQFKSDFCLYCPFCFTGSMEQLLMRQLPYILLPNIWPMNGWISSSFVNC